MAQFGRREFARVSAAEAVSSDLSHCVILLSGEVTAGLWESFVESQDEDGGVCEAGEFAAETLCPNAVAIFVIVDVSYVVQPILDLPVASIEADYSLVDACSGPSEVTSYTVSVDR